MADVIYQYGADIKQILAALNQIDKTNEKVYKKAERDANAAIKGIISGHQRVIDITKKLDKSLADEAKAYAKLATEAEKAAKAGQGIGASAGVSGAQIGAISGIVSSLTTAFIQLGQQAVGALIDIGEKSIQTALEMDTLKARLGGIFDGSEEAADQAFGFIQKKSKELGFDLSELAGAFIPKTESLAQFERVAKIATALARSDPEQGAIGARIALIEALSGTFVSLQRRFEIGKDDTKKIQEAFNTEGIEGFLSTLEQVLAEGGRSFDDFANTAATSFARLGIAGEQIGGRLGAPIVASLEEAANKILSFIDANEEDLIVFADTIGRAISDVIDFIAGIDFSQLDTQTLIEIADYIFRIVGTAQLAGTQILTFIQQFSQLPGVSQLIQGLAYELKNLDDALLTLSQILALANASIAAFEASGVKATVAMLLLSSVVKASHNDFVGAYDDFKKAEEVMASSADAQDAFRESIAASNQQFADYRASVEGNTTAQDELRQTLDETANAGTAAADAIQAAAAAEREAEEAAAALEEAQAKVNEAMAEAKKDFDRKLADIDIAAERKRLDIQIEFAQKREDAARNNLQKLADIQRKNQQDITDAATDLERKEEDIARKFANERIDLEREQRQSRLDIETSFRQKLEDIQKQSAFDLEEAERNRDAVGFIRILRQQQKQVSVAQTDRQREIEELRIQGERKKEELAIQQQREIEEAHIANERKLEDLRLNLERQIEAQNIAYAQQLQDLAIGEQRKNEEAARARERDIEDAKLAYERKLADLQESLAAELAIIQAGNAALEEEAARHAQAMADAEASTPSTTGGNAAGFGSNPGTITGPRPRPRPRPQTTTTGTPFAGFQHGGRVRAGQPIIVGEKRPELFVPPSAGRIMPNLSGAGAGQTVNNSSSKNINLSVPADRLTPGQRAEARQLALEVLDGVS